MDTSAPVARPAMLGPIRDRIWPQAGSPVMYAMRASGAIVAVLLIAYLGICFRYADKVSLVEEKPVKPGAAYVAATHEDVSFRTSDGLTLKGWWFPASQPRDRAAVLVHGKDQNRAVSTFAHGRIATFLLANGYSTLLFDLRGHGESDGLRWGLGQHEAHDIAAAVDLAAAKAGVPRSRVAVIAESMGAGSALMALKHVPDVGPMVLDSVYTSAPVVVSEIGPSVSGLPAWFTPGMSLMAKIFFAVDIDAVVPIEQVRAHADRAFLFIHCANDTTVALHHGLEMRAAANAESGLWVAQDCGHVKAFSRYPDEWRSRVLAFLERELGR